MSMDDNMLDHIMDVKTSKEACGTSASIFYKKPKSMNGKVCYQWVKQGHITCDCKVQMVVIEGNSTMKVNFMTIVKICEYVLCTN